PGRRDLPVPRQPGISVRRIADEREPVRNQRGLDAELLAYRRRVADLLAAAIDLHDAIALHALREILVRRPDVDLLHTLVGRRDPRRARERVVRLELDHRPHDDAHRVERLLERMKLREQLRLDPFAGLVVGPKIVAERFDHVIRADADVRRALLDHLEHRIQYADDGAERPVAARLEALQPVEMPKQLVCAVDEMDDHAPRREARTVAKATTSPLTAPGSAAAILTRRAARGAAEGDLSMRRNHYFLLGIATAALAGCEPETVLEGAGAPVAEAETPSPAAVDAARLANAENEPGQWMSHGRTYSEQRFSPLDQITTENVGELGLAWYADFDTERGQEATPLMVDGVIYVSTAWSKVNAYDAKTGEALWSYDSEVPGGWAVHACCDVVNRGVAVWEGKVYVGTLDGRLVALDAATGEELWDVNTIDR